MLNMRGTGSLAAHAMARTDAGSIIYGRMLISYLSRKFTGVWGEIARFGNALGSTTTMRRRAEHAGRCQAGRGWLASKSVDHPMGDGVWEEYGFKAFGNGRKP